MLILKIKFNKIFKKLLNNIYYKNKVFVHRDFHISNLMITKKGLGLIDSQDAVYGNIAYDLASLIDDVRFKTDVKTKNCLLYTSPSPRDATLSRMPSSA